MSSCCHDACNETDPHRGDPAFKRVLWIVLAINAAMFVIEIVAGLAAGSASLQADALDFLGRYSELCDQPVRRRHGLALSQHGCPR